MSIEVFDLAFERTFGHELGFQNDPNDRGNWTTGVIGKGENKGTKGGISAMSYPSLDIKNLTAAQIKEIYYKDYWALLIGVLAPSLMYQLFDAAIAHGAGNANKILQKAIGAKVDGNIGPKSLEAVNRFSENDLLILFLAERLEFMTNIKSWDHYGKGWARRIANNLKYAAKDSLQ